MNYGPPSFEELVLLFAPAAVVLYVMLSQPSWRALFRIGGLTLLAVFLGALCLPTVAFAFSPNSVFALIVVAWFPLLVLTTLAGLFLRAMSLLADDPEFTRPHSLIVEFLSLFSLLPAAAYLILYLFF